MIRKLLGVFGRRGGGVDRHYETAAAILTPDAVALPLTDPDRADLAAMRAAGWSPSWLTVPYAAGSEDADRLCRECADDNHDWCDDASFCDCECRYDEPSTQE